MGDCLEAYIGTLAAEDRFAEIDAWLKPVFEWIAQEVEPLVKERVAADHPVKGMSIRKQPVATLLCSYLPTAEPKRKRKRPADATQPAEPTTEAPPAEVCSALGYNPGAGSNKGGSPGKRARLSVGS